MDLWLLTSREMTRMSDRPLSEEEASTRVPCRLAKPSLHGPRAAGVKAALEPLCGVEPWIASASLRAPWGVALVQRPVLWRQPPALLPVAHFLWIRLSNVF